MVTLSKYKWELRFAGIALAVVLLDQLLKYLVLAFNPSLNLKIILIHLVQNTGAGFGIFKNQTLWLGIISLCAALLVLFSYKKIDKQYSSQILWAVFLGGVVGNMFDRFFRGYVIDFIDSGWWPAFNLADACITISVIGLIVLYWRKKES
ncbi:MAG: signal peptidase II [Candidatus Woesearchaeota archaeon]|jgi:signal peptidase II